jgi:protocatechuate 3,4-dioxygenase beta subunit
LALSPVLVLGTWIGKATRGTPRAVAQTGGSSATRVGQAVPACVVTPQETEGPYFVDEMLFRSDIRADPADDTVKEGTPMRLGLRVSQVGGGACSPLVGAVVDVWHCDALGVYSDVRDPSFNTVGKKFLRGAQTTDETGSVEFMTIYPGWYQGRAVHIHYKVRTDPQAASAYQFTSQLYFDDALTDVVHAQPPYSAKGQRTLRNAGDGIFRDGGDQLLLNLSPEGDGYAGVFDVGVAV